MREYGFRRTFALFYFITHLEQAIRQNTITFTLRFLKKQQTAKFCLHYNVTTVRIWPLECTSGITSDRLCPNKIKVKNWLCVFLLVYYIPSHNFSATNSDYPIQAAVTGHQAFAKHLSSFGVLPHNSSNSSQKQLLGEGGWWITIRKDICSNKIIFGPTHFHTNGFHCTVNSLSHKS